MRCLLKSCTATVDRKLRALHTETAEWFRSDSQTALYDYENVCAVLGIDAGWLRKHVFWLVDARRRAVPVAAVREGVRQGASTSSTLPRPRGVRRHVAGC